MNLIDAVAGPHSLRRYAPLFQIMHGLLFLIGVAFWIDAVGGAAAFSPDAWGEFAYFYPAWAWAAVLMATSTACLVGLIEPIHRWLVILGGGAQVLNYIAISYSAFFTGGDPAVGLYAGLFFLPLNLLMTVGALTEWKP
jgi:hypothetical protein